LCYVATDGTQKEIPVSPPGPVVRCCDPFNQRVYVLMDQLCEETAGKTAHVSNPAGRRAQICMKFQLGRCNMSGRCQQIHADRGLISAYRTMYHQERKEYVAEIDALDVETGQRLVFKYSEVDACQAKDRYRSLSEQERSHFVICQAYASTGQCAQGRNCHNVHVSPQTRAKVRERAAHGAGAGGSLNGSFGAAPSNFSFNSESPTAPASSGVSTPQQRAAPLPAPVKQQPPASISRPPIPNGFPPTPQAPTGFPQQQHQQQQQHHFGHPSMTPPGYSGLHNVHPFNGQSSNDSLTDSHVTLSAGTTAAVTALSGTPPITPAQLKGSFSSSCEGSAAPLLNPPAAALQRMVGMAPGVPAPGMPAVPGVTPGVPAAGMPTACLPTAGLPAAGVPLPAAGVVPAAPGMPPGVHAPGIPTGVPAAVPATGVLAQGVPAAGVPATGVPAAGVPTQGLPVSGVPSVPAPGASAAPALPGAGLPAVTSLPAGITGVPGLTQIFGTPTGAPLVFPPAMVAGSPDRVYPTGLLPPPQAGVHPASPLRHLQPPVSPQIPPQGRPQSLGQQSGSVHSGTPVMNPGSTPPSYPQAQAVELSRGSGSGDEPQEPEPPLPPTRADIGLLCPVAGTPIVRGAEGLVVETTAVKTSPPQVETSHSSRQRGRSLHRTVSVGTARAASAPGNAPPTPPSPEPLDLDRMRSHSASGRREGGPRVESV